MPDSSATPPAIDPETVTGSSGSILPAQFHAAISPRVKKALGTAAGLTQFGVNLVTLGPGAASSQRHWHSSEDEFVYVLTGRLALVTNSGEQILGPGMAAGFPAGVEDGHHLINRGPAEATYLEIGSRAPDDDCSYADIDLHMEKRGGEVTFRRKDGSVFG